MTNEPSFKLTTSEIHGYQNGAISLQINAPHLLTPTGSYRGQGTVYVSFSITGRIIDLVYIDQMRAPDGRAAIPLKGADLKRSPNVAFVERMRASEFGTVAFEDLVKLTELWPGRRSNICLTGRFALASGEVKYLEGGKVVDGKLFDVHLYRVMRVTFRSIVAIDQDAAVENASELARRGNRPDEVDDCEGEIVHVMVDLQGDDDYESSKTYDFGSSLHPEGLAAELLSFIDDIAAGDNMSHLANANTIRARIEEIRALLNP